MKTMPLQDLKDLFSDAIQGDLEQGVAWLNDEASERFAKAHPRLLNALGVLSDLDAVTPDTEPVAWMNSPGWITFEKARADEWKRLGENCTPLFDLQGAMDPSEQVRAAAEQEDAQENPLSKRGEAHAPGGSGG